VRGREISRERIERREIEKVVKKLSEKQEQSKKNVEIERERETEREGKEIEIRWERVEMCVV